MSQISAIERLQGLPHVFRGAELTIRFHWASKTASHYLYLWKKRKLVAPLGGHSDVFVNLLRSDAADWEHALLLVHPSAVLMGLESLRQFGWSTQIPNVPTVAVDDGEPHMTIEHFAIHRKPERWMKAARQGLCPQKTTGIPVLRPAWALADLVKSEGWGACGLQPDDIDWDAIKSEDEADWTQASAAFGLPATRLADLY